MYIYIVCVCAYEEWSEVEAHLDGQLPGGHQYEHSRGPPSSGAVQEPLQDGQHVGSCLTCMMDKQHSQNDTIYNEKSGANGVHHLLHSARAVGDHTHLFPWQRRHRCPAP